MPLQPQTGPWYDRLTRMQSGYYYPWRSRIPEWHGEDVYLELVRKHLGRDVDVLDVACGHGEVALEIAPLCRTVLGYDRTGPWVEMAQTEAQKRGLENARFVCHDSSPDANGGIARLPAGDASMDLLICSKGPFHWVEDARRVARPGATLIMLVPNPTPVTPWTALLPEPLRWETWDGDPLWALERFEARLAPSGLAIDCYWTFTVPESFERPEDLYAWRAWGCSGDEVPAYEEAQPVLERIFQEYAGPDGLRIMRSRFLWMAHVPG